MQGRAAAEGGERGGAQQVHGAGQGEEGRHPARGHRGRFHLLLAAVLHTLHGGWRELFPLGATQFKL